MSKIKIGNIKGPKGDKGEQGAVGPKGEQGIQGPVGPAGGVNSVNGKTGDVNIADALGYTPVGGQGVNLLTGTRDFARSWNTTRTTIALDDDGFSYAKLLDAWTGSYVYSGLYVLELKEYTISFYAKAESSVTLEIKNDSASAGGGEQTCAWQNIDSSEWKKYTATIKPDYTTNNLYFLTRQAETPIYIKKIKLEPGTVTDPVWTPAPEDVVTKTPYDIFEALDGIPEMHRNLYGGRNLGESTAMSEAHKKAIQDGSFRDLFVGDYWTHDSINYRIADVDYFYNCGDTTFTKHHLVIVPDTRLSDGKMNTDNTTENGYVGSEMRQTGLEQAKEKIQAAFPDMVLTHRDYFTNKVTNGVPSEGEWTNSDVELMNEIMVYGCHVFAPANNGTIAPNKYTTGNSQLALFRLNPRMIKTRYNYWLRDVFSAAAFALVNNYGLANCVNASYSNGVRPYFCIGVQAAGDEADDDMEVVGAVESTERMEADEMGDGADTGAETDATKTHDEIESDANEKDMEDV